MQPVQCGVFDRESSQGWGWVGSTEKRSIDGVIYMLNSALTWIKEQRQNYVDNATDCQKLVCVIGTGLFCAAVTVPTSIACYAAACNGGKASVAGSWTGGIGGGFCFFPAAMVAQCVGEKPEGQSMSNDAPKEDTNSKLLTN